MVHMTWVQPRVLDLAQVNELILHIFSAGIFPTLKGTSLV